MEVRRCQVSVTLTGAHVLLHTFGEHQMMTGAATHESAALRRLVAFMQRDEDEAEASRQAALEEERKRAAIAHKGATERGMDPKTKRIVKYVAEKYSAWVELHAAAAGFDAAVGPTVELLKEFSSHCFSNRKYYSVLGNSGMGASFG